MWCVLVAVPHSGFAANGSLGNAWRARAMLGPGVWARIIRVENGARFGAYPRVVFALVFEFGGILWFYTDTDGTQSFSLHVNRLAAEKADFGPLLRDIEPGFASFAVLAKPPDTGRDEGSKPLPNGCFIESVAAWRERLADGEVMEKAKLLSYYFDRHGHRRGHTVLAYETPQGAFAVDPDDDRALSVGGELPADALALARRLRPDLVITAARWAPTLAPALVVTAGGSRTLDGKVL